jgi:zinc protease
MLPAGSAYDPRELLGLAHFVSRVIDRGTARRSANAVAEALDDRGVSLSTSVNRHLFMLSCVCLAEDVPQILDVVADIVRHPTFPAGEVDTRRGEIVTAIRQDEDNPTAVASERLMELLYRDGHPYGRLSKGTLSSLQAISREHLQVFHRSRFFPAGLAIAIVGDIETSDAVRAVERSFGDWGVPGAPLLTPPAAAQPLVRQRAVVSMPNKAQADIAYGFTAVRRHDPSYYATLLMNNVLGQYGLGGRLGDRIRERDGMAYYAYSTFDGNVAEGPLVIRAGVSAENVDTALDAIDEEVRRMAADGVTSGELADAKQYLIGSLPRMLETNSGIATFLLTSELYGLGLDFHRQLPGLLDQVTIDDVNAAARRILAADRASVVIAGPYADTSTGPI